MITVQSNLVFVETCKWKIVSCLRHWSIDRYCLVDIVNKIALRGSGVDSSELLTDTLNPDRFIWISTVETYDFLNPLFWDTLTGRLLGTLVDKEYNNLKINKKWRPSIDLNIHNSRVTTSTYLSSLYSAVLALSSFPKAFIRSWVFSRISSSVIPEAWSSSNIAFITCIKH